MDASQSPVLVLAAPHRWLRETLLQVLQDWPGAITSVDDHDALLAAAAGGVDIVVLTPFAFGMPAADLLSEVQQVAPLVRVVALIPDDDGDYRLAALRGGADAVVCEAQADVDLLPTLQEEVSSAGVDAAPAEDSALTAVRRRKAHARPALHPRQS